MYEEFEEWLSGYIVRDGSVIRPRYCQQLISYLNRLKDIEGINLEEEYEKDQLKSVLSNIEKQISDGIKNKNTGKGDITAVNKYIEFRQVKTAKIHGGD